MKKFFRLVIITALLLTSMQILVSADSLQDNLVPQDRETGIIGEVELDYNEHPQHHYELDTYVDTSGDWMPWNWADGAGKQIYIALMEIINAIWQLNVLLANFTMVIVQEAFELDFVSNVVDEIGAAIQNIAGFNSSGFMANGLWPLLVTFVLCLVGTWATYVGMVKRESSRAWGGLISALIIFVFSLGFFSNAGKFLGGLNEWSSNLQSDILGVSASIVNPGASYTAEEGIATIRNQMFDLMVKKPYLLMQYGTAEVDEGRVNDLLAVDPILGAQERQEKAEVEVNEKDNAMMSIDGITQRAAFVPLLFIGNSIIGIFLLMISGSIILFQLIFLALALFAPVPLLMALVPRWQQTAVDWAMKLLHAQLMKIAIALLLTILFGISAILYRATESSDLGYLGMMILQIICFVGIWAKRKDLFSMVSTAANNVQSSTGQTLQNYKQKYNQAWNTMREIDGKNGRARNQPLSNRNKGSKTRGNTRLADRQGQQGQIKENLAAAAGAAALLDRGGSDFQEGKEGYKNQLHNRANVENAPNSNNLMERQNGSVTPESQRESGNTNVTNIDDLRRRRLGTDNVSNAPLVDRQSLRDAQRESAASTERPNFQDADLVERQQSDRNVNLLNQHSHQDKLNQRQENQLTERRGFENTTEQRTSQDTINRNVANNQNSERNVQETVNRNQASNENSERNIQETVNRNRASNESSERNIQETVNRSHTSNENNSRITNEVTERNDRVTENNVTQRNEETTRQNRKQVNVNRIIENARQNDRPITQWEAEQQINANRNRENRNEE
ncbi:CD3337/EF1877 family mobilome membrane protein [Bacillus infantis]|uniref:CD3337/EF1877 family mobilome membrane protein n=1 Tax=Bacillus infantis TaxID=324767 RepID=UPI0020059CEE|nr:conjugal transfer protein [Bacillus infantis]MCK6208476.1 conjugal transfer protein [Bacillus infantis]MCP1161462.1 conjugal transfer protein [Bacillus infantis]